MNAILNILSLIVMVLFFELVRGHGWNFQLLIYELVPLFVLIITWIKIRRTISNNQLNRGNSRNASADKQLDYYKTINSSYSVFAIVTCTILLAYTLTGINISMVLVIGLIYFANITPSYIMILKSSKTSSDGSGI